MPNSFTVSYKIVESFFDSDKVIARIGRRKAAILSKFGAFVRRSSRSSIRRRKRVSAAGQPPSAHSKDSVRTIKNILFGLHSDGDSVLIGPVGFRSGGGMPVPELLEKGGAVSIRERKVGQQWRTMGRKAAWPGQPTRVRMATYQSRPFMLPALKKEAPKFPQLWANIL